MNCNHNKERTCSVLSLYFYKQKNKPKCFSYKKKVWITSPTTLISTLTTLQILIKNIERDKYTKVIHQELRLLDDEFKRYKDRWDKLYRSIETVSKDVKDIHTTTDKITKRFNSINQVEMEEISYEEAKED